MNITDAAITKVTLDEGDIVLVKLKVGGMSRDQWQDEAEDILRHFLLFS